MRFIYAHFLILLLTLVAVKSDDVAEEQTKRANTIRSILCEGDEDVRTADWYKCIQCCQSMQPFYTKYDPNALARALVKIDPNASLTGKVDKAEEITGKSDDGYGVNFDEQARDLLCNNPTEYSKVYKNLVLDLKGSLKPDTETEIGLKDFEDKKDRCFSDCREDSKLRTNCDPFVPSYLGPPRPAELTYYNAYIKYGSNSATVAALGPRCDELPITDPDNCIHKPRGYTPLFSNLADFIERSALAKAKQQRDEQEKMVRAGTQGSSP